MLESLDQSNIKRMNVENPESEKSRLDVRSEFTQEDKQDMMEILEKFHSSGLLWHNFAQLAGTMNKIGIPVEVAPEQKQKMLDELEDFRKPSPQSLGGDRLALVFIPFVLDLKKLNIPVEISTEDRKKIDIQLQEYRESSDQTHWDGFVWLAANLKELNIPVEITEEDNQGIMDKLQSYRRNTPWDWRHISDLVQSMDSAGIPAVLTSEEKQSMQSAFKRSLEEARKHKTRGHGFELIDFEDRMEEWGSVVHLAEDLIQFSDKTDILADSIRDIPEQRSF